jgi:hypothetical protein
MQSDMDRYAKMMERQYPRQFAFATSDTLNTLARVARDTFRREVAPRIFETKNKYVASVVEDRRNSSREVESMESAFGELTHKFGKKTTSQLRVHETGGTVKPINGRKRIHDGTLSGRGGSMRRPLRKAFATAGVKTVRDIKPTKSNKARGLYPHTDKGKAIGLMVWAQRANYSGLLRMRSPVKGAYGDFKIMKGGKIKMVRSLEKRTRVVAATHWMEQSYRKVVAERVDHFAHNMGKQIDYLKTANKL